MSNDIPGIREFCFSPDAPATPDVMLASWARAYLNNEQFKEFRRLIGEIRQEGVEGASIEQMIGVIEMAKFLVD